MNRNIKNQINDLAYFISNLKDKEEVENFMSEIFTPIELDTLSKRWRILNLLVKGKTQRDISQDLQVSLCKVTRGAKILKNKNSIAVKYLIKEN